MADAARLLRCDTRLKVSALVAGMLARADPVDDMALHRHGGMRKIFARTYDLSTLGSVLPMFTSGHVRQLDAVARSLVNASRIAPIASLDAFALLT
jgi:hypothetical protein